jgi:hypothetical protein
MYALVFKPRHDIFYLKHPLKTTTTTTKTNRWYSLARIVVIFGVGVHNKMTCRWQTGA